MRQDTCLQFTEACCFAGSFLMLWDEISENDPSADLLYRDGSRRFGLNVALLHANTGLATGRELYCPLREPSVAAAFAYGGVSSIDYAAASGVIAACSLPQPGLPPPAVLIWDWDAGACLQAVLLHPLPPARPQTVLPAQRPTLRFAVGARVECQIGRNDPDVWAPGVVAEHYPAEDSNTPVYLIHLDGGEACFAPADDPSIIRAPGGGEDFEFNRRTRRLEVRAKASLVLHPSSTKLAIGLWHAGEAAGVLYSVDLTA